MNVIEYEAEFALKDCQICGLQMKDHPRCGLCGILAGPGHIESELHPLGNKLVCTSCKDWRAVAEV